MTKNKKDMNSEEEEFFFGRRYDLLVSDQEVRDHIHELYNEIYVLENELKIVGRYKNEINKLLVEDKSAIIDALENGRDSVKIGGKKFDTATAVEKYKMELEEVITRVEDQRLIGSKGNVVQTKRCLCDFIVLLDKFTKMYDSVNEKIVDLKRENEKLSISISREKRRVKELESNLSNINAERSKSRNQIDTLTRRVASLLDEIDELKKPTPPTSLNQKRTIQRK